MADVELIIKIPDEAYKACLKLKGELDEDNSILGICLINSVANGTLLPKGHGRLIDADTLKKDDEVTKWITLNPVRTGKMLKAFSELFIKKVNEMPTINAIPIPDNATNGDVIKALFPKSFFGDYVVMGENISFDIDWWNAKYKGVLE